MTTEKKIIIYLDQNFISDIAKLSLKEKKNKINPILEKLFNTIKEGVDEEKFLSPDSWIHAVETAKENNPELKNAIFDHQGYIGQVSLNPNWEIEDAQFINALLDYFGIKREKRDDWHLAFRENPNKRIENFKIHVRMPDLGLGKLPKAQVEILQQIRASGVKNEEQYKKEIEATKKEYKKKIQTEFAWVIGKYNLSLEQAEQFIESKKFLQIPKIDIFCKLWSKNLANINRDSSQLEHDYNDIEFLSSYLPYCDVVATDKYMQNLVQSLKLDETYGCRLYTMKTKDLSDLIVFLEKEKQEKKPAKKSLFSVLGIMTENVNTQQIQFLKKLNLAKSKFENTGKYWNKDIYTSIFLVYTNKKHVELPKTDDILKYGPKILTNEQWLDMFPFMSNFRTLYNLEHKSIREIVKDIPNHLRGTATAIVMNNTNFDNDVVDHDSYLFYDIEDAIKNKLQYTKRYNIEIIYP